EGVVATSLNLTTGTTYEITLQGAQRWVRIARLVSVLPGALVLELDNGRQLRVPQAAIVSARPLAGSGPSPGGLAPSRRGTAKAPGRGVSPPVNPESFYFTYINEKGSDVSAAWLLDLRTRLLKETSGNGASALLKNAIADALDAVARELLENEFERHESAYELACQNIQAATAALDSAAAAGRVPPAYFRTLLRQLTYVVDTEHSRYLRNAVSSPDFVSFLPREHFYVGDDQTFLLTVSVGLPPGDAPVESVQLLVGQAQGLRAQGQTGFVQMLRPGETRELVQRLKVSDLALGVGEATISLSLRYRCTSGHIEESPARSMVAVLEPARKFVTVVNPYSRYSGGTPVDEQKMFFGRRELLDRIYSEVTTGPLGQCFVLYGQKRSGKSSVLRQLTNRLRPPSLTVYLSLGTIDTARAERSFVQACIDALYERLVHDFDMTDVVEHNWPREFQVEASPIESFRRSVRAATRLLQARKGWRDVRPIFLIDEFTYVYEYIREGLLTPAFMRQWKSLLESRTFDAVLVGQDTMPRFKEAYPNEFGVTHDERISYLSGDEARALAENPIMMGGESRYKGASLDRLLSLTAGSAFYLQIFCDRLVQHLNRNRLVFITESVVGDVLGHLTTGPSALSIDKFDPLITAAGESVALAPKERYLALLTRVALNPLITSQDVAADDAALVRDLFAREVLERDAAGRLRIRVGLFAEWLRANSMGNGA
ncbi:MAG: ATP-binding protein, partial [Actinobacteria bacterium]|nr:ATP-binding protein [Actinomycetota bacterium]